VDAMDEAARQSRVLDGEPDARKLLIHHHDAQQVPQFCCSSAVHKDCGRISWVRDRWTLPGTHSAGASAVS